MIAFRVRLRDTMWHPSALSDAQTTPELYLRSGSPICPCVSAFHIRTEWSADPETTRRPSALNETHTTVLVCPSNGSPTCVCVSMSHSLSVSSAEPDTTRRTSGGMKRTSLGQCDLPMVARKVPLSVPTLALFRHPMRVPSSLITSAFTRPECPQICSFDSVWRRAFQIRTMPMASFHGRWGQNRVRVDDCILPSIRPGQDSVPIARE